MKAKLKLSNGVSQRGAQMGRSDVPPQNKMAAGTLKMEALEMVDGDYDEWGAYWGNTRGTRIYCLWGDIDGEENTVYFFRRAKSAFEAWDKISNEFPNIKYTMA